MGRKKAATRKAGKEAGKRSAAPKKKAAKKSRKKGPSHDARGRAIDPSIRIRMYHIGFGDCFLVSLPTHGMPRHVLVDCGVHSRGDRGITEGIVQDILKVTNKRIDLVVASHAHQDHISGFGKFEGLFRECSVCEIWLPWTEDQNDRTASELRRKQLAAALALQARFAAADSNASAAAKHAVENLTGNAAAMAFLRSGWGGVARVRYLSGGEELDDVAGVPGLSARVLAPPRDQQFLARMNPPKNERFFRVAAGEPATGNGCPIPKEHRLPLPAGRKQFQGIVDRDGKPIVVMNEGVEAELQGSVDADEALAFYLDQVLNNTSLCFKLTYAGRNLLFPGDAQYGNWQSWIDGSQASAILGDVDFYKVSHHGSHNGTPKSMLGMLPEGRFAAMASTQSDPWPSIPQKRLIDAVTAHSGRQLARTDSDGATAPCFERGDFWIDCNLPVSSQDALPTARPSPGGRASIRVARPPASLGSFCDPMAKFSECRQVGRKPGQRLPFESGEHVWLGDAGAEAACVGLNLPGTFLRSLTRLKTEHRFSYGELVALSGDFYGSPVDLFEEEPAFLPWLWESNDLGDIRSIFDSELKWIEEQRAGGPAEAYPDDNIRMAWNAKSYIELALANSDHFGWHNMVAYCKWHQAALDLVAKNPGRTDENFRRAVFYNAFADHFLTDGFAAGHIRVPRAEIREWATSKGYSEKLAGALSKLLHDQDGHVTSVHGQSELKRPDADGLRVRNSLPENNEWSTRCDGQLFLGGTKDSHPSIRYPVSAVAESVRELLGVWQGGAAPVGEFAAAKYVPFPHSSAGTLLQKFPAKMPEAQFEKLMAATNWYSGIPWIGPGLTRDHVHELLWDLAGIMKRFRNSIEAELVSKPELKKRLPVPYIEGMRRIS